MTSRNSFPPAYCVAIDGPLVYSRDLAFASVIVFPSGERRWFIPFAELWREAEDEGIV